MNTTNVPIINITNNLILKNIKCIKHCEQFCNTYIVHISIIRHYIVNINIYFLKFSKKNIAIQLVIQNS
jgi:hypothetical protein